MNKNRMPLTGKKKSKTKLLNENKICLQPNGIQIIGTLAAKFWLLRIQLDTEGNDDEENISREISKYDKSGTKVL